MPRGESAYLPLAQELVKGTAARGAFLYVMEGTLGDSWCVWAPPEVAARLPELVDDAADDILAGEAAGHAKPPVIATPLELGEQYHGVARWICRRAEATLVFLYVVEGRGGSGWAVFAAPKYTAGQVSELIRGFADDLKAEEKARREQHGLT